ncbi:Aminomethyltransferase [Streptomyces californicus]
MSTAPRLTALDALHRSLGATMTDFAGWDMPLRYASERDEHNAVRTRAGLFDLSHMGEITVTGPEAAAFLSYALVGNIATVGNGRARYTMIVQEDGGIVDDLIVYRLGETEYMVVANAGNAQIVLDALTARVGGFDAEVRDDRDAYALLAVQGPESPAIMKAVTDADLDGLKFYAGLPGTVAGVPALIARTGYTGEDGFELFVAPEHAEQLWRRGVHGGRGDHRVRPQAVVRRGRPQGPRGRAGREVPAVPRPEAGTWPAVPRISTGRRAHWTSERGAPKLVPRHPSAPACPRTTPADNGVFPPPKESPWPSRSSTCSRSASARPAPTRWGRCAPPPCSRAA